MIMIMTMMVTAMVKPTTTTMKNDSETKFQLRKWCNSCKEKFLHRLINY